MVSQQEQDSFWCYESFLSFINVIFIKCIIKVDFVLSDDALFVYMLRLSSPPLSSPPHLSLLPWLLQAVAKWGGRLSVK